MDCDLGGDGRKLDGIDTLYQIQHIRPGIPVAVRSAYVGVRNYEQKAKEKGLNILRWWDTVVPIREILEFLDENVYKPLLQEIRNSIIEKLEETCARLDRYESFLGDIDKLRLIGSYEGEVEDI